MIKYTKHFLKKIEDLFSALEYTIRYERGNFKSGYCIVEDKKVAVINRFFETDARINALVEILSNIEMKTEHLDEKDQAFYKELSTFSANNNEEPNSDETTVAENEKPVPLDDNVEVATTSDSEINEVV